MLKKAGAKIKKLPRYFNLYGVFIKNCLMAQMEFRFSFFLSFFIESAFLFVKLLYIIIVFGVGVDINGMSPYEITLCMGLYTLLTAIMDTVFYSNVSKLPELIRNGDLDFYITKPVSLQFMVSFRYLDFGSAVPNIAGGLAMIIVAWKNLNISADPSMLCGFIFFSVVGLVITYPILMIPALLSFWIVKTDQLMGVIWSMWDFNNMPMGIYNRVVKDIGTFIIPIFVITNFAPLFVMHKLSVFYMIWSVAAAVLLMVFLQRFFKFAVRHYSSASS
jgi:ABC-2 type transport system permease protein